MATVVEGARARSVSVGRVFERAFSTIRHNPATTLGLAFLLGAIPGVLTTVMFTSLRAEALTDGSLGPDAMYGFYALTLVSWALNLAIFALTLAGLTRVTVAYAEGDRATFGESLMAGLAVLVPLIVLAILFAIGVMIGFVLLVVPGAILYVMWSVAVPALVQERRGIMGAFGRSRQLTKGARWRVFAVVLIMLVIYYLVSALAGLFALASGDLQAMSGNGAFDLPMSFIIVSIVVGTLVNALWATVQASLYVELRHWKEGPANDALEEVFA